MGSTASWPQWATMIGAPGWRRATAAIGATGVSMHALCAMQLTGAAGDLQVKNARLGGIFNMGGTSVANYVSILERIK